MSRLMFRSLPLAIVLAAVTACGDDPVTPTVPTPVLVTEVFSGTINQNSAATHTFTAASGGPVTVPPETVVNVWVAALFWLIVPLNTSVTRTGVGIVGVVGSSSPQAATAARTMASGTERNIKRDIDLV